MTIGDRNPLQHWHDAAGYQGVTEMSTDLMIEKGVPKDERTMFTPIDPVTGNPIEPSWRSGDYVIVGSPHLSPQTWDGLKPDSRGDWMQTSQGRQFWPLDPRVEDVHIEDIAAALARMCRYGGQLRDDVEFYSVAEHSVHVAAAAPPGLKLAALLHDATEAYLQDIIRPVKPFLRDYATIEERLAQVIGRRFGLTLYPLPAEIKRLDNAILADERDQVMAKPPTDWRLIEPALGVQIHGWLPNKARFEFLAAFRRYGGHWC